MNELTTTLSEIRKHGPCPEGWATLLASLNKASAYTREKAAKPFRKMKYCAATRPACTEIGLHSTAFARLIIPSRAMRPALSGLKYAQLVRVLAISKGRWKSE